MLKVARQNVERSGLSGRIRLVKRDAKALGGFERRFDLVFSNSLLHHLREPIRFWRQVGRLLKPGGAVMIQDLSRPRSRTEARRLVALHAQGASPLLRELFHRSLLAAYTPEEVRLQLKESGLENLNVRKVSDRHWVVRGRPRFLRPFFERQYFGRKSSR
jgi:ubiquinone/menaquinone biosynthesis C-methylase UbiE